MRIAVTGFLFVLSACSANPDAASQSDTAEAPQIMAADGKPPYGLFDVTAPDGQVYREEIRADGTFSSTAADGSAVEGTWEMRAEGVFCSKPKGAPDHVWRCKNEALNDKGVWTSTEVDGGEVSTVVRLDASETP